MRASPLLKWECETRALRTHTVHPLREGWFDDCVMSPRILTNWKFAISGHLEIMFYEIIKIKTKHTKPNCSMIIARCLHDNCKYHAIIMPRFFCFYKQIKSPSLLCIQTTCLVLAGVLLDHVRKLPQQFTPFAKSNLSIKENEQLQHILSKYNPLATTKIIPAAAAVNTPRPPRRKLKAQASDTSASSGTTATSKQTPPSTRSRLLMKAIMGAEVDAHILIATLNFWFSPPTYPHPTRRPRFPPPSRPIAPRPIPIAIYEFLFRNINYASNIHEISKN